MHRKILTFASTLALASLVGYQSHASALENAITSGSLSSEDTVAFLMLGVQDGVRFRYGDGTVATVHAVGRGLGSNEPYGYEIRYGNGGPSLIVSVRENSGCTYTMDLYRYQVNRVIWPNEKPKLSKMELDFTKAVAAFVVVGDSTPTGQVVGVECTPTENAENECANVEKDGFKTFASGADMLKAFAYFQTKFCPRQQ